MTELTCTSVEIDASCVIDSGGTDATWTGAKDDKSSPEEACSDGEFSFNDSGGSELSDDPTDTSVGTAC